MSSADFSYLDVLPIHPPPEAFESLTSYVTRLGEENGITDIQSLTQLFFPDLTYNTIWGMGDLPTLELSMLALRSHQTVELLRTTTLYHLLRKFGSVVQPAGMGNFLSNVLSKGLRYCPLCLATACYYRLPWRFLILKGCPHHEVNLLDRCCHCGNRLSLLQVDVRVGVCAICKGNLSKCPSTALVSLNPVEVQNARRRLADLEFLLSPQSWEQDDSAQAVEYVTDRFDRKRSERNIHDWQVASALKTTLYRMRIYASEGTMGSLRLPPTRAFVFSRYVAYADYIGLTLKEILTP